MKTAVRYYSRSGNTKKLALALGEAIGVPALDVSAPLTERVDILFLGSSVYAGGIDESVKRFIAENRAMIGQICNFSTSAIAGSTWKQVKKQADQCGVVMAEQEFYCWGSFAIMHRGRPNDADLNAVKAFAKSIVK